MVKSLYPTKKKPYYIVCPRYVRTSAGIRALHLLCHWLNRLGEEAYMYISPSWDGEVTRYDLLTPILNEEIFSYHRAEKRDPIVILSEVATENIFNSNNIVRFFGHYTGHLGKFYTLQDNEMHYFYSSALAKLSRNPENVLFIPTIDTGIFHPPTKHVVRSGTCYYAAKYKTVHKQEVFGLPEDCFEILRDTPDQLTQHDLAALFMHSELLYCFEDSAIAIEAALCGCPVVLMENDYFNKPIAIDELSLNGLAWGNSEIEISRAKETISQVSERYYSCIDGFKDNLEIFIQNTQDYFLHSTVSNDINFPNNTIIPPKRVEPPSHVVNPYIPVSRGIAHYLRLLAYKTPFFGTRLIDRARLYEENIKLKQRLSKYSVE